MFVVMELTQAAYGWSHELWSLASLFDVDHPMFEIE